MTDRAQTKHMRFLRKSSSILDSQAYKWKILKLKLIFLPVKNADCFPIFFSLCP